MKKICVITLVLFVFLVMINGCSKSDATVFHAARELPFPVLVPDPLPEGWEVVETVYEDELLVVSYRTGSDSRVELVQDLRIQGLDTLLLRDYLLLGSVNLPSLEEDKEIREISNYVGELTVFLEPIQIVQYTFVTKEDLIRSSGQHVPLYQVIGKQQATIEEVMELVGSLKTFTH
ncbi:DUF4245 domain-containing protein [Evansella tamaricis]|uniref:DUF4245 domain-containing protein n=1 Tax=Evansella tamaricis TaxID=2069301 RepID=A0ABS6JJ66_9BACI|nr:DUF4245 domain-containing protein [Evansella tamaricis]MBU9713697.1 DUF4245 domain-containing protein [Evansella tamaricis]